MFADASTSDGTEDYPILAGASTSPKVGDCLSAYSPKDKPWDTHKAVADRVALLYAQDAEFRLLGDRVLACSGLLLFAWLADRETGELLFKLRGAQFCRVRHCPVCQWRRSMMWQAKFYQALPSLQAAYPRVRWLFLTLTVKNCPVGALRANLAAMNGAWNRLRLRSEFKPVLGFVRTTEVTRAEDGSAHPHFHVLMMVRPSYFGKSYVTQARWAALWQECARLDYAPVVDIRAVKGDLSKAVQETLKYAVKPADMEANGEWLLELTRQLHKLRFIATGGALKDVFKPETEITNADMVNAEASPEVDPESEEPERLAFGWDRPDKHYRKKSLRDE
jgi:plasmid rolling circle replication initiator protein Rep